MIDGHGAKSLVASQGTKPTRRSCSRAFPAWHTHTHIHTLTHTCGDNRSARKRCPIPQLLEVSVYWGVLPGSNVERLPRRICVPSCPALASLPLKRRGPVRDAETEGRATNLPPPPPSFRRTCLVLEQGGAAVDYRRIPSQCDLCNGVVEIVATIEKPRAGSGSYAPEFQPRFPRSMTKQQICNRCSLRTASLR